MGEGTRLDDLARELANGSISRRAAIGRIAAGALGIGIAAGPSALADELERGRCPKKRRCGKKCCPKGAKCKNGKCKCKGGLTKCGKKCVDLQTDATNCGACKNACADGELCVDGACEPLAECVTAEDCAEGETCDGGVCEPVPECQTAEDCGQNETCDGGVCEPAPECQVASDCPETGSECVNRACVDGTCGTVFAAQGTPTSNQTAGDCQLEVCDGQGGTQNQAQDSDVPAQVVCQDGTCQNGVVTYQPSQNGTACPGGMCQNGACVQFECTPGETQSCYSGPAGTEGVGVCRAGSRTCTSQGTWGQCQGEVLPSAEVCDGLDNNCNGQVDEGNPGGGGACFNQPSEPGGPPRPGVIVCMSGNLVCVSD